jgi:hypothetical protein
MDKKDILKKYWIIGLVLILFAHLNFLLKIQPFANWYIIIVWWGYILIVDSIVLKLKGHSLIYGNFKKFLWITLLSIPLWGIFEVYNYYISIPNWIYSGYSIWAHLANFTVIFPAIFETASLLKAIHLFDHTKLKNKPKISKVGVWIMIVIGLVILILPFIYPSKVSTMLLWLGFFFLLDPINYLHHQPSFLGSIHRRKGFRPMLVFMFGALICGFFWEFWNYLAIPKWRYFLPAGMNFFKIFEMPILGYLGYLPFGLEVFSMFYFVTGTLKEEIEKGEKTIEKIIKKKK